jgi:ABC-type transport system involved in cytochrome c biogenesis permease subunit
VKEKLFPIGAVLLALAWVLPGMSGPSTPPETLQVHQFGRIPVVNNGRIKPMDTIARTHLRIVANRETFKDKENQSHPAIVWLLDVETEFADPEQRARKHPVFRIDDPQIRDALGLAPKETYRYSIEEFGEKLTALAEPLKKTHDRKENGQKLDQYENQLMEFERHLGFYERLSRFAIPHVIPPKNGQDWRTLAEAVPKGEQGPLDPDVDSWKQMLLNYGKKDVKAFNDAVKAYLGRLESQRPDDVKRAALESSFNNLDPFNKAKWLYLVGFVLACLAWLGWSKPFNRASWALLAFTFVLHTVALAVRMHLSGRPPVTNLYSSAIFIGWGSALIGLVLERIYKLGVGNIITAVAGFATLQIAHILAADGDTMEVLQAVLDTQFWLATHVTSITLGYATTYVAGLIGIIYILRGVFTTSLTPEVGRNLTRMIYGTVCFATFFSFVGTVLGGLWADDSWGRFWGWDPKENGALMIVLWNALFLHARWGGIVRERGMAILAVLGNIVVSWSWFGVNQLGVGLHSYGFTNGITVTLVLFAISQLGIMGCALFPAELWRSKPPAKGAPADENGNDHA